MFSLKTVRWYRYRSGSGSEFVIDAIFLTFCQDSEQKLWNQNCKDKPGSCTSFQTSSIPIFAIKIERKKVDHSKDRGGGRVIGVLYWECPTTLPPVTPLFSHILFNQGAKKKSFPLSDLQKASKIYFSQIRGLLEIWQGGVGGWVRVQF